MSNGGVSLRILILGMLAQQSMSGYDITRVLKSLDWLIGSPSPGSLYPILHGLLSEGLVSVEVIPGLDRPPRKIYSISEAGQELLYGWSTQAVAANVPMKAFVMNLLLANNLSPHALASQLKQRLSQVADQQVALERMLGALDRVTHLGQFMAANYGLALAAAERAWLEGVLAQMADQPQIQDGRLS